MCFVTRAVMFNRVAGDTTDLVASQPLMYSPQLAFPSFGSTHSPFDFDVSTDVSHRCASAFVRKVRERSRPSGARYRARQVTVALEPSGRGCMRRSTYAMWSPSVSSVRVRSDHRVESSSRAPVTEFIEPLFDVGESVADVPPDSDSSWSFTVRTPPVHGRERNTEVVGELDRAEETRSPAIGGSS